MDVCRILESAYGGRDLKRPARDWVFRRTPGSGGWSQKSGAGDIHAPAWFPLHCESKYDQSLKIDHAHFIQYHDKCPIIGWMKQSIRDSNAYNEGLDEQEAHGVFADSGIKPTYRWPTLWIRMDRRKTQLVIFWSFMQELLKAKVHHPVDLIPMLMFKREEFRHDLYGPLVLLEGSKLTRLWPDRPTLLEARNGTSIPKEIFFRRT